MIQSKPALPYRYQTDHPLISSLFVWPAKTAAQASTNEWLHDAIHKIRGLNHISIGIKVKLEHLSELSPAKRDEYMSKVFEGLSPDDLYHPDNLGLHALDVAGEQIFGKQADLLRAAAELGISTDNIELAVAAPVQGKIERPTA